MTSEELERLPSSRVWTEPPPPDIKVVEPESRYIFFLTNFDGTRSRVMWTEDGRIVPVDEYQDYL